MRISAHQIGDWQLDKYVLKVGYDTSAVYDTTADDFSSTGVLASIDITLANLGFTPQMTGVNEYVEANPADFDANKKAVIAQRLKNKADRMAVKGNSWQNLYPKELRAYQDWWAKVQAA